MDIEKLTVVYKTIEVTRGADGPRSVSAKVNPTAAGKTFSTVVTVLWNGNAAPKTVGTDQIVASLPAGTTCSGGTSGNLCLVQFITTAGFGNCVVGVQSAGTAANGTAASTAGTATNGTAATTATTATNGTAADSTTTTTTTDGTTTNGTTAATGTTTTTGAAGKHHKHKHAAAAAAGNAASGNAAAAGSAVTGSAAAGSTAAGTAATGDAAAGTASTGNEAKVNFKAGTRAPRALLHTLETR
ncbi:hypothetical protein BDP27DRAFT_1451690 [Rhodocollybia butyracea]|uniref:Uncharacterized protein n=1 Tax=Rhodocollybia butyracea TaxID=206335 RepID=A0A9P5PBK0_9AGAR|nr:hypothetical protein BDP27DRAFT_1451690 [Rhodocollybia butyracea]